MTSDEWRQRVYQESMDSYRDSIKFQRWFIAELRKGQERFWDKLELYQLYEDVIQQEEELLAHYKRCILELGTGKRLF